MSKRAGWEGAQGAGPMSPSLRHGSFEGSHSYRKKETHGVETVGVLGSCTRKARKSEEGERAREGESVRWERGREREKV